MCRLILFPAKGFSGAFLDRLLDTLKSFIFVPSHGGRQSKREDRAESDKFIYRHAVGRFGGVFDSSCQAFDPFAAVEASDSAMAGPAVCQLGRRPGEFSL
jgi:hypothetical protein